MKNLVSIPLFGSNLFKYNNIDAMLADIDGWVSIPLFGSNLFKWTLRSLSSYGAGVSIPLIGSNLFKSMLSSIKR